MAIRVAEIMNRELFSVPPGQSVDDALGYIRALGISGAPVVDAQGVPLGMLSFRDAVHADAAGRVEDEMSRPVMTVRATASIDEAGRLMAESGYHRLIAVDEQDKVVGIVSALDVVRGLLGMPAAHPSPFPHYDAETGLVWTDDVPLEAERIEAAPGGAGVLVLVQGGRGVDERSVWVEATQNLHTRLLELVTLPQASNPALARVLRAASLRFRAAGTADLARARRVADEMLRRAHGLGLPQRS